MPLKFRNALDYLIASLSKRAITLGTDTNKIENMIAKLEESQKECRA